MTSPSVETPQNPIRNPYLPAAFTGVRYEASQPGIALAAQASLAYYSLAQSMESPEADQHRAVAAGIAAVLDMVEPSCYGRSWMSEVTYAHRILAKVGTEGMPDGWERRVIDNLPPALTGIAGLVETAPQPPAATYQTPSGDRIYDVSHAGPQS